MGQKAEFPLGRDEIGGVKEGRGGGKMDGKSCVYCWGGIRIGQVIGHFG